MARPIYDLKNCWCYKLVLKVISTVLFSYLFSQFSVLVKHPTYDWIYWNDQSRIRADLADSLYTFNWCYHPCFESVSNAKTPLVSILQQWIMWRWVETVKLVKHTFGNMKLFYSWEFFAVWSVLMLQQLMSLRSDAPFRDAKNKLLEIRSRQTERLEQRTQTKDEKQKRKKQKKWKGPSLTWGSHIFGASDFNGAHGSPQEVIYLFIFLIFNVKVAILS